MLNVALGLAGGGANALVTVVTVPILLQLLGANRYGLYVTVTAAMGWLQLGILGVGKGLVNTLVAAHARGDETEARRFLWSFWAGLAGVIAATGVLAGVAFPFVPWGSIFPPPPGISSEEVVETVAMATIFTLLALALSPLAYVYSAYQENRKSSVLTVVRNTAILGGLAALLGTSSSMPRVVAAVGFATLAVNGAALVWLIVKDKPFLRPQKGDVTADHMVRAIAAGGTFFVIDLAGIMVYQTDKLLILQFSGATSVVEFELASYGFLLAQSVFGVIIMPMWPALGEAVKRGDHSWARRALARLVRGSVFGTTAVLVIGVLAGPFAIRLWTGDAAVVPSRLLLGLVGLYYLVRAFTECYTIALFVVDRQRLLFPVLVANGILTVGLGIVLGRPFGVLGVAASNVVAYACTQGIVVPLLARRYFRQLETLSPLQPPLRE